MSARTVLAHVMFVKKKDLSFHSMDDGCWSLWQYGLNFCSRGIGDWNFLMPVAGDKLAKSNLIQGPAF